MHRYYHSVLPNWNPAWMLIPLAVWAILLSVALSLPVVDWRSGQYCEFRPANLRQGN